MNNISLEQFKTMSEYQQFIQDNPSTGTLKVQVFRANQAIPLPNTQIFITKKIGNNNVLFFQGVTDSSGIIDNIILPAPSGDYNVDTFEIPKYTTYNLIARDPSLNATKQHEIAMFGNVKVLQYIKMLMNGGNA